MTMGQGWGLAKGWYSMDRRAEDWRRLTPEKAEALFEELGLTSSFWDLG